MAKDLDKQKDDKKKGYSFDGINFEDSIQKI